MSSPGSNNCTGEIWQFRTAMALGIPVMGIFLTVGLAHAAGDGGALAQVQSLDRLQAEQERLKKLLEGKPKAYEDKVMDPSTLPPQADTGDSPPDAQQTGFRGYVVETRMGFGQTTNEGLAVKSAHELGVRTEYRRETLNYGDFVLQADLRTRGGEPNLGIGPLGYARQPSSERITLRNLGFPVTPKMFADTSVGDISSEVTDALSRAYRLSLGSSVVRGIGTRVFDGSFDLRAGIGERGNLAGGPYPGFERSQGTLAWAGYSQRLPGDTFAGIQVNRATSTTTNSFFAPTTIGGPGDGVTSLAASLGHGNDLYANGSHKARLIYVRSQTSPFGVGGWGGGGQPARHAARKASFWRGACAPTPTAMNSAPTVPNRICGLATTCSLPTTVALIGAWTPAARGWPGAPGWTWKTRTPTTPLTGLSPGALASTPMPNTG